MPMALAISSSDTRSFEVGVLKMKINKLGMDLFPMYGVMIGSTKRTIYHIRNPSSMIKLQKKKFVAFGIPLQKSDDETSSLVPLQ